MKIPELECNVDKNYPLFGLAKAFTLLNNNGFVVISEMEYGEQWKAITNTVVYTLQVQLKLWNDEKKHPMVLEVENSTWGTAISYQESF